VLRDESGTRVLDRRLLFSTVLLEDGEGHAEESPSEKPLPLCNRPISSFPSGSTASAPTQGIPSASFRPTVLSLTPSLPSRPTPKFSSNRSTPSEKIPFLRRTQARSTEGSAP
jgi:hypothetical protein